VPARFLYLDGDVEFAAVAPGMARDLVQVGISTELVRVSRADMGSYASTLVAVGEPVLWLVRR
jgi:hypothetical protein